MNVSPVPDDRDGERDDAADVGSPAPTPHDAGPSLFKPVDGAFNGPTAAALTRRKEE